MAKQQVLCVYYSRTGKTRAAMEEVSAALGGELVELDDGVNRAGVLGAARSCLDAVRKSTRFLKPFAAKGEVKTYDLVVIGTPVWAGRCSSVVREFLKKYGRDCRRVAYVITRGTAKERYEQVYDQMDRYTAAPHVAAVSLKGGDAGEHFWRDAFVKEVREILEKERSGDAK